MGGAAVSARRRQRRGRDRGGRARPGGRGHGPARGAVRRGGADGHLGRGVGRRLLRGRRRVGHRAFGVGRPAHGAVAGGGRRGCGAPARLGHLLELRTGADGTACRRGAAHGGGLAGRHGRFGPRGDCGPGGRRRVRDRGVLVVRRVHVGPAALLAGHRQRPAVSVLVVGELGVGGVRDRVGQRRRYRPRIRRRGDQAALRACVSWCSARCWRSCARICPC